MPRHLSFLISLLGLCGCASSAESINEYLDTRTAVTVTSSVTPLVLYRENPSVAAYARNYIHLGPIEINQMGSYRYYLWIGAWNTMEVADSTTQRNGFDSITIFADSEPLFLELAGSTPAEIGTSRSVYVKPVASSTDAYYPVTIDQIRLIAEAREIRVRTTGRSAREYSLWGNQRAARASLDAFLQAAFF